MAFVSSPATPLLVSSLLSDPNAKSQLWGTVVAAIAYGIVVALSGKCIRLLAKTKYIYAAQKRWFLFIYVVAMLSLSTATMVQELVYLRYRLLLGDLKGESTVESGFLFPNPDSGNVDFKGLFLSDIPFTIPMTIWGADGFMLWRCIVLYEGASWPIRWMLYSLLGVLAMVSIAAGILFFFSAQISVLAKPALSVSASASASVSSKSFLARGGEIIYSPLRSWITNGDGVSFSIASTPVCNIVLAALIVGRLLYHQRYLRRTLGMGHGSPYTRIITMCIESCALIIASGVLYLGLFYAGLSTETAERFAVANGFPLLILPHICVIAPILIVARVAQGRTDTFPSSEISSHMVSIAFAMPISTA